MIDMETASNTDNKRMSLQFEYKNAKQNGVESAEVASNDFETGNGQTAGAKGTAMTAENCTSHSFRYQILAAIVGNIISLCHGMALGFLSPILPTLQSNDSPFHGRPITLTELSWVGSCYAIGTIVGNFVFSPLASIIGQKRAVALIAIPNLLFWVLVLVGEDVVVLYIGRIFAGAACGGLYICLPLFIAEIADPGIRGRLNSLMALLTYVGILFGYITGSYLSYYDVPKVPLLLPIVFFVIFCFFPETHQHHIARNNIEKAKRSLRFYRDCRCLDGNECVQINAEIESLIKSEQKRSADNGTAGESKLQSMCQKNSMTAILMGVAMIGINVFSGQFAMVNYMVTYLKASGAKFDANTSSIIIAVIQIFGMYASTLLVDRIGRKILFLVSTFGAFVSLTLLGGYSYLVDHGHDITAYSWIPLICFAFFRLIICIGILPIPFVVIPEILPIEVRQIGSFVCMLANSVFSFISIHTFPILMDSIHLYGVTWICAGVCLLGTLFTIFIMPETKKKNLNESQQTNPPNNT